MRKREAGDKSRGICPKCKRVVGTTLKSGTLEYLGNIIPDVLQYFCDDCGESVGIPHESTETIRDHLNSKK